MRYATEYDREKAELDRMVARMRAAAEPFGHEVLDTAESFVRGWPTVHTANSYARALMHYFRWCVGAGVHPWTARHRHAAVFRGTLGYLAPGTQRNYLIGTRAFYRFAVIDEVLDKNPFQYVKTPCPDAVTPTPAFTMEQLQAVLRPMHLKIRDGSASLEDRRDFTVIAIGSRVGVRLESICEVAWAGWAYRGSDGVLTFVQKGGGAHVVTLAPEDAERLEAWRAALAKSLGREPAGSEPIFPNTRFNKRRPPAVLKPMRRASLRDALKRRYLAVGLRAPRLAVHVLRATMATVAAENGATDAEIQQTGGWKSAKMVPLYKKRQTVRNSLHRWSLDLDGEPAA